MNTEVINAKTLEELLAKMPEVEIYEPTLEEAERMRQNTAELAMRERIASRLSSGSGWPSRYARAAETPPEGKEWLSAFETAKEIVTSGGILILFGKRGGGKTRMSAELSLLRRSSAYRTAMRFFLEVRSTFKPTSKESELDIIKALTSPDILTIDELQERGDTPWEDRLLTHVVDSRYGDMKPTILIANLTKSQLAASLGDSIVSRTRENGKSIEFTWQSFREKGTT